MNKFWNFFIYKKNKQNERIVYVPVYTTVAIYNFF